MPHRVTKAAAVGTQTLGRRPVNRGNVLSGHGQQPNSSAFGGPRDDNSDCDQPPRFLMHTSSGNIFIPSGWRPILTLASDLCSNTKQGYEKKLS